MGYYTHISLYFKAQPHQKVTTAASGPRQASSAFPYLPMFFPGCNRGNLLLRYSFFHISKENLLLDRSVARNDVVMNTVYGESSLAGDAKRWVMGGPTVLMGDPSSQPNWGVGGLYGRNAGFAVCNMVHFGMQGAAKRALTEVLSMKGIKGIS
jgi:hypothetical protein